MNANNCGTTEWGGWVQAKWSTEQGTPVSSVDYFMHMDNVLESERDSCVLALKRYLRIWDFNNTLYHSLLLIIKSMVEKKEYQNDSKGNKNILRISIQSLGSPIWTADNSVDDTNIYGQDLVKFMYCLRILLRDTYAVAYITVPSHLFEDNSLVKRLHYSVDNSVRLESFAGSCRETNPVYKDYHGLFHLTKLSAINSLVPYVPPSLDLAFKLRRKKFIIEKLHLPPELQESSEREQDDITATPAPTCGGFKKKDIEF